MNRFKRVLVANRGEIAVRIIKSLKEMGLESVAIYSSDEKDAPHVQLADKKVCIGKGAVIDSYLNSYNILAAAASLNVTAIHPGIGFFAENSDFAEACEENGIIFIGPNKHILETMGNKSKAKQIALETKLPIIPGSQRPITSLNECYSLADKIGYPVLLKAIYGGGGKGIRSVKNSDEMKKNYELCIQEANSAFGKSELLMEKKIIGFKHIEVQILADAYGNVIHLGDRECTIQRSKQKIIEEATSVNIPKDLKNQIYKDAIKLAKQIGYIGPGTVEFLVLPNGEYYFMEMNTRLQVEHTITEMITGIDIVKEQLKIFQGMELGITQEDVKINGYALQCRIIAENSDNGFRPSFGTITNFFVPSGSGIRVDYGYRRGNQVLPYYDSLIAKICCKSSDKEGAIRKMETSLDEVEIEGIHTNISLLKKLIVQNDFFNGNYTENYLDKIMSI